jgi:chromosome segregation ATPase
VLQERRRREWRIELREAAIERKALKERIANLEARLESQQARYEERISSLMASMDQQRRTIEALLVEKRQHMAGLEAILAECQSFPVQPAAVFRIESIALNALNK